MLFCPFCGTLLLLFNGARAATAYRCPTCPYETPVTHNYTSVRSFCDQNRAAQNEIFDSSSELSGGQKTKVRCEECENDEAYFIQVQMRSADEPPTTFYKCTRCGTQWKQE